MIHKKTSEIEMHENQPIVNIDKLFEFTAVKLHSAASLSYPYLHSQLYPANTPIYNSSPPNLQVF